MRPLRRVRDHPGNPSGRLIEQRQAVAKKGKQSTFRQPDSVAGRNGWFADFDSYRLRLRMFDVPALLKTIYLGDRACKSIKVDGWNDVVMVEVDCISRVRGEQWNYYNDENLDGGFLVFEDVASVELQPPGLIPDDLFGDFRAEPSTVPGRWAIVFKIGASKGGEVEITIDAAAMHLRDAAGTRVP